MNCYKMSEEEKQYLSNYDIAAYERPSVATDIAIFSILKEGISENIRKLPKKELKILLIKRASYPYKDGWALPGGFCRPGEDVAETARRELFEETNIKDAYLQLFDVVGTPGRDPRGWIISNTFLALMDGEKCHLRAGSDAWEAKWFTIRLEQTQVKHDVAKKGIELETEYTISLSHEETGISLQAKVVEQKKFANYHETITYKIIETENIGFDHAKIILQALLYLRKEAEVDSKIVFDLMPDLFTLTQLQHAFETILDRKLLAANFRRKIAEYVEETEEVVDGMGHRPAKLFRRNLKNFYQ